MLFWRLPEEDVHSHLIPDHNRVAESICPSLVPYRWHCVCRAFRTEVTCFGVFRNMRMRLFSGSSASEKSQNFGGTQRRQFCFEILAIQALKELNGRNYSILCLFCVRVIRRFGILYTAKLPSISIEFDLIASP